MAPLQLRVGGAFITLAAALFLFTILSVLRGEELFALTLQTLTVLIAAVIIGAFATVSTSHEGSRTQVAALIIALVLIGLGVGAIQLVGDSGAPGFYGANPPAGHGPHRYLFAVHAVDVEELPADQIANPTQLGFNLYFHSVGRAIAWGWTETK